MEKDLLVRTGYCLDDIGGRLSWSALGAFLRRPDLTGEIAKDIDPELSLWSTQAKTNIILADIFDMLAMLNANLCAMGTGKRAQKPKSYPRPNDKDKQRIGKKALPMVELEKWFAQKRADKKRGE